MAADIEVPRRGRSGGRVDPTHSNRLPGGFHMSLYVVLIHTFQ